MATKDFTDSTYYAPINLEQSVSDLSFRLASVEEVEVVTPTILDTSIGETESIFNASFFQLNTEVAAIGATSTAATVAAAANAT